MGRWRRIAERYSHVVIPRWRARAEAAEAEVERLSRECLDRESSEMDARERLRRFEDV